VSNFHPYSHIASLSIYFRIMFLTVLSNKDIFSISFSYICKLCVFRHSLAHHIALPKYGACTIHILASVPCVHRTCSTSAVNLLKPRIEAGRSAGNPCREGLQFHVLERERDYAEMALVVALVCLRVTLSMPPHAFLPRAPPTRLPTSLLTAAAHLTVTRSAMQLASIRKVALNCENAAKNCYLAT
jgi:hypothetical protein